MIKVLELFSGTKSIGKVCDQLGWESVSVDLIMDADHKCDIMDFDYKQYEKDEFDIVWASPPCTEYSKLQDCWLNRMRKGELYTKEIQEKHMTEGDVLIKKTFEIINYFNCEYWFMENPQSGRMKDRDIMKDIPFYDVDYCMYSNWGYRKRTRIWTNKKDFEAKLCDGSGSCGNMTDIQNKKQHTKVLANGYEMINGEKVICNTKAKRDVFRKLHKSNLGNSERQRITNSNGTSQTDRYRIPEDLIFSLFLD